eukprot:3316718-Amphidinium_carterae.1
MVPLLPPSRQSCDEDYLGLREWFWGSVKPCGLIVVPIVDRQCLEVKKAVIVTVDKLHVPSPLRKANPMMELAERRVLNAE